MFFNGEVTTAALPLDAALPGLDAAPVHQVPLDAAPVHQVPLDAAPVHPSVTAVLRVIMRVVL